MHSLVFIHLFFRLGQFFALRQPAKMGFRASNWWSQIQRNPWPGRDVYCKNTMGKIKCEYSRLLFRTAWTTLSLPQGDFAVCLVTVEWMTHLKYGQFVNKLLLTKFPRFLLRGRALLGLRLETSFRGWLLTRRLRAPQHDDHWQNQDGGSESENSLAYVQGEGQVWRCNSCSSRLSRRERVLLCWQRRGRCFSYSAVFAKRARRIITETV